MVIYHLQHFAFSAFDTVGLTLGRTPASKKDK